MNIIRDIPITIACNATAASSVSAAAAIVSATISAATTTSFAIVSSRASGWHFNTNSCSTAASVQITRINSISRALQWNCNFVVIEKILTIHPMHGPHPLHHVDLRIRQKRNQVGYGQPIRFSTVHICWKHFQFHASMRMSPGYLRRPYIVSPTHGNVTY